MEILGMEVCVISDLTEALAVAENTTDAIVNALMLSNLISGSTWVRDRDIAPRYPYLTTLGNIAEDWETYLRRQSVDKVRRMFDGDFYFYVFSVVPSEKTT